MKKAKKVAEVKTPINNEMAARFPMNIDSKVWEVWQSLRRKNDAIEICKRLNLSRPVIDRALNYGHVKNQDHTDRISAYFLEVKESREGNSSKELIKSL